MRFLIFVAIIIGLGMFYLQSSFGTVKPCEALRIATVEDAPWMAEIMESQDREFRRLLDLMRRLRPDEASGAAFNEQFARNMTSGLPVYECAYRMALREIAPGRYRNTFVSVVRRSLARSSGDRG